MAIDPTRSWSEKGSRSLSQFSVILVVVLLGVLLAGCGGDGDDDEEVEPTPEPTVTPTLEDRRSEVVRELRTLMQMETAVHSVETVIEAEADGGFLSNDRMLLVAHGQIRAGVDLTALTESSVEIMSDREIHANLPASEIFELIMDEDRTQVVSRDTGLFASEDEGLEAEAIEEARIRIMQSACDHAILERAATEAESRITVLLTSLGYEDVTVITQAGSC